MRPGAGNGALDRKVESFLAELRRQSHLGAALRLLEWDQETFLPAGSVASRAAQIGTVSEILHERRTAAAFVDLVDELAARVDELPEGVDVDVRETAWQLGRERGLPSELVRERAEVQAEARSVWVGARQEDDFARLAPWLERLLDLERKVAGAIDASRPAYDVLLEGFEPGARTEEVAAVLGQLRAGLVPLVERIREAAARREGSSDPFAGVFPVEAQRRLSRRVARQLGFDFERGRLDEAAHPFSTEIGDDRRITSRYDEADLRPGLFSTIHETGHALYEQGLPAAYHGLPRGAACSLAVHESQSRLWENLVGRSEAFWRFLLPIVGEEFPALRRARLDAVVRGVNELCPSLIRTEADEVTYNLHIILRFELERALVAGELPVAELPSAWRHGMREMLGVEPSNDRDGVLQDVHWACGSFGYFPTYTLGNLYAAQLMEAAEAAVGPLGTAFSRGEFDGLRHWLMAAIHAHGQRWRAPELMRRATGREASAGALLDHLTRKVDWITTD